MIGYTMVGTNDLERSVAFYDALFTEMAIERVWLDENAACWGKADEPLHPRFFTCLPFDERPASIGNGSMTAFLVDRPGRIDQLYRIALRQGGSDEGPPGLRPEYSDTFHAAYVRDPDGNKLAFVHYGSAEDPT